MAEWYYEQNNQQTGPIETEDFETLIQNGTIQPTTLVWAEGMDNWLPLHQVNRAVQAGDSPSGEQQVICSECGGLFDVSQAVEYAGQWVCAGCKPVYTQRMLETGATVNPQTAAFPGHQAFAGFWIRVAAMFIDNIILNIPIMLVGMGAGFIMGASGAEMDENSPEFIGFMIIIYGIAFLLPTIYFIAFHYKKGATPGKMACGLKVVNADGSPLSLGKSVGRYFAFALSGMICYIGYIMAGFDEEKKSLHDIICDTRVIYKARG